MGTPKCSAFYTSILGGTLKRGAFCTSILGGTPKRGAFRTSYLVATLKRAAFSYSRVGAYCIRPIRRHPTDGECANRINYHDSSFHKWNARGAYAIRPYMGTPKRGAYSYSQVGAYCIRPTNGPSGRKSSYTFDHHGPFFYP